jgi:hypothetical protein
MKVDVEDHASRIYGMYSDGETLLTVGFPETTLGPHAVVQFDLAESWDLNSARYSGRTLECVEPVSGRQSGVISNGRVMLIAVDSGEILGYSGGGQKLELPSR